MTSRREPPQPELEEPDIPEPDPLSDDPDGSEAAGRQRRPRPEPNPALDPRLVQLERRSKPPSRALDASLMLIGVAAFIFGVAMHFWVATSILEDDGEAEQADTITATATPDVGSVTVTPTTGPQPTATPLPDRTSCDEIRGTQYRSVTEREFFLENCTS